MEFIGKGGAVLAASDRAMLNAYAIRQLTAVSGVSISDQTLICRDLNRCYENLDYCPFLVPVRDADPRLLGDEEKSLLVATNVPSKLERMRPLPGTVQELATLPDFCRPEPMGGGFRPRRPERERPLFAVGGDVGKGRVLVLADHSLFINEMMLPTNNQNVEFTSNCMAWLRGEPQKRDLVLFVEDGRIQTKFDIPLKNAKLPLDDVLKMIYARRNELLVEAERGAARMEEDDAFNRNLLGFLERIGWPIWRLARYFAILGTLVLALYGAYRLGISKRFRHDQSIPLLAAAVGRALPVQPLHAQRTEALLLRGNLWEPASVLVRRWFTRLGVDALNAGEASFTAQGAWWRRRKLLGRLQRLWRLAGGRQPERR